DEVPGARRTDRTSLRARPRMYNAHVSTVELAGCRTRADDGTAGTEENTVARGIRLGVDEAWATIERAHTGVLTTLRPAGVLPPLPVWFVVLDRRIYLSG